MTRTNYLYKKEEEHLMTRTNYLHNNKQEKQFMTKMVPRPKSE